MATSPAAGAPPLLPPLPPPFPGGLTNSGCLIWPIAIILLIWLNSAPGLGGATFEGEGSTPPAAGGSKAWPGVAFWGGAAGEKPIAMDLLRLALLGAALAVAASGNASTAGMEAALEIEEATAPAGAAPPVGPPPPPAGMEGGGANPACPEGVANRGLTRADFAKDPGSGAPGGGCFPPKGRPGPGNFPSKATPCVMACGGPGGPGGFPPNAGPPCGIACGSPGGPGGFPLKAAPCGEACGSPAGPGGFPLKAAPCCIASGSPGGPGGLPPRAAPGCIAFSAEPVAPTPKAGPVCAAPDATPKGMLACAMPNAFAGGAGGAMPLEGFRPMAIPLSGPRPPAGPVAPTAPNPPSPAIAPSPTPGVVPPFPIPNKLFKPIGFETPGMALAAMGMVPAGPGTVPTAPPEACGSVALGGAGASI
mmetsp:Transcript_106455/g.266805  ORF Transcript_106455/g.266805 Transcript_106455/m.266805 type:complete len:420 (-) Transcript_106455:1621-2880(-)